MIQPISKQSKSIFLRSNLVGGLTLVGGLALACVLAAACGSGDDALSGPGTPGNASPGVPLFVSSAGIEAEVETAAAPGTRAPLQDKDATIGLFLRNVSSTDYTEAHNISYTCNGSGWSATTESEILYLTANKAKVYAYRPWTDALDVHTDGTFWLYSHIQKSGEIPLAMGRSGAEVNADKNKASFVLQPAYACLTLKITREGTFKDDVTINKIILSDAAGQATIYSSGVLNLLTNAAVVDEDRNRDFVNFSTTLHLVKGTTETCNLLMFPGATVRPMTSGLKIGFCISEQNNKVMSTTIGGITTLERGKQYIVTLKVNGTDVTATSVETVPWTASAINNGGSGFIPLP